MPPHVPRKRLRTPSPEPVKSALKQTGKGKGKDKLTPTANVPARKSTLFDDLDAGSKKGSAERTRSVLQQMQDDDDDSSSLSSHSDAEFEDVPATKRQKVSDGSDEDDEDMEFEDVPSHEQQQQPELGDLELTLYQDPNVPLPSELGKKGPSKREKAIRASTHCLHVQFLLWHNAIRNSWLCDEEVQAIMISHIPPRIWEEVDRWRRNSGLDIPEEPPKKEFKGKRGSKGKTRQSASKPTRDWGEAADRLERGVPDMSHGDPLLRLAKCLLSWWKQRFRITAPGLRKWGYMDMRRLGKLRNAFEEEEEHDPERFGERVRNIEDFRMLAQDCVGSRDVGAQLFTALLRGLGLEARMVANVQSLGFGFSKIEDADEEKSKTNGQANGNDASTSKSTKKRSPVKAASRRTRKSDRNALRMELDDSDEYAEPLSDNDSGNSSVEEIAEASSSKRPPSKPYDKDLEFPHYWTEILSPVTKKYVPVDTLVKSVVASNRELVESFEPRGGKADKAKQISAYFIGFSPDGTAKDVTVRYLRKQLFPGKTKGVRMPEEKVPVYNKHGKVKRYERYDWFKSVMRGYSRGTKKCPITEVDEKEDSTDLKPAVPEKKEIKEGEETLQYYKTSKDYVLRRHLKREEALLPDAVPVKVFRNKGKGRKVEEEDVYLRKDVVTVKSAETWHKQGRGPIEGAEPLKEAPYRAATTNRRREIAEAERATGKKVMQPLYSWDQTDWIIPDPIQDGVIPKNEYGNIDMFAEHMCPEGAVHVPYRGCVRVCKRLNIDYAEAVVGFEFGHRMAVPVIQGVVIAMENYERVVEELEKDEAERARKEDEKRRKAALNMWRRLLMGMRIADRIRQDYGSLDESVEVFGHDKGEGQDLNEMQQKDEDMAGGFLPEGYEEEEMSGGFVPDGHEDNDAKEQPRHTSAFFSAANHGGDDDEDEEVDPFEVEYGQKEPDVDVQDAAEPAPEPDIEPDMPAKKTPRKVVPKKAAPKSKANPRRSTRRRTRRRQVESSEEDDDDEDDNFELGDSDE
ncbi:Rad4-domain-containing protein [Xylariomycetidae sp. FL0641]|nr:Rad4-domain-containing protein [Xylariomycetidae sp. FL0641]